MSPNLWHAHHCFAPGDSGTRRSFAGDTVVASRPRRRPATRAGPGDDPPPKFPAATPDHEDFTRAVPRGDVDANQETLRNPFGMDEACTNCPALCEARENVVHGYGDVGAEFLFIGEMPSAGADAAGVPLVGDAAGERLQSVLGELGFARSPPDAEEPDLQNAFLTYLTRCRHPDRGPTDGEVRECEAFLTADVRMINPQILVPIGQRVLEALAVEYTTRPPESFDVAEEHATTIRGRGFEIVPMVALDDQSDEQTEAFVEHVRTNVLGRDYRQTKGRRSR